MSLKEEETLSATKAFNCPICGDFYKTPKMLSCGHSLCLECVVSSIKNEVLSCPECSVVNAVADPKTLQTNVALQRAVEVFKTIDARAELETSLPVVIEPNTICSVDDTCHHLLTCKAPLSCPHCAVKFCRSCQVGHKERLKVEIQTLAHNISTRRETSLLGLDKALASIRCHVDQELQLAEQEVTSIYANLEHYFKQALEIRRSVLLKSLRESCQSKLHEIDQVIAKAQVANSSDLVVAKLNVQSSLSFSLDELAKVHRDMLTVQKDIESLEHVKTSVLNSKLYVQEDGLKRSLLELLASPITCHQIQWCKQEVLEEQFLRESALKMHDLIKLGDVQSLREFFNPPSNGWTAEALKFLVSYEGEVEVGLTPLMHAASRNNVEICKILLESLPYPIEQNINGAAFLAAAAGCLSVLTFLVNRKPNLLEEADPHAAFLIHRAAGGGHVDTIKFLLRDKKAQLLDRQGEFGRTPLHYAIEHGHVAAVQCLLDQGANVFAKDANSKMSLHLAVSFDRPQIVKLLVRRFPDLTKAKDNESRTALSLAKSKDLKEIVRILEERRPSSSGHSSGSHPSLSKKQH